ncbi:MAG: T9SS type A sorting domain-containing protein [Bacteroidaceae bacterium]|nr:T9SS type A sorting domain-containing protein [Bacteroidaceae bacterium]
MKKSTLAIIALLCGASFGTPAQAQYAESATDQVYDFSGFTDKGMLDLFYNALQKGRNYPTLAEFEAAGIQASDIAFVRSHVRKAEFMSRADRLVPGTYEYRNLWMNIPMDVGSDGLGGYPSKKFSSDVFSMWQYTNLFGSWNHGVFQAPAAWVDAAHRNGTDIMSGIKFFESWTAGSGDGEYSALITKKDSKGNFLYVKPLINCLMYFGADGINYNWEDNSWQDEDITAFHKQLYKEAAAQGFTNFHAGLYTANSTCSAANVDQLLGSKETGQTFDLMLNYAGGDFSYGIGSSAMAAEASIGTTEDLYTGVWIVGMDRRWTSLNESDAAKRCGVCLWGEHGQSRFMSYNAGGDAYEFQGNYQRLLERAFSGGFRNPIHRPAVSNTGNNWEQQGDKLPLSTFAGLATWIPERSTIKGNFPFATHFTLGNGERYYYKGKKTHGGWYNMGGQDVVPTYRWLVLKSGTQNVDMDLAVNYVHNDAYVGGSAIELSGKAVSTGTDIVLYKTSLKAGKGAYAKVAVKTGKEGTNPTNLYLILQKKGGAWVEVPVGNTTGKTWEEMHLDLTSVAEGDVIERIGFRVKGNDNNYKLLVGKLELNDKSTVAPANVKDLNVEVKEETKGSMAMKLYWGVDATAQDRAKWDLLFNDEANIHHFEILYKVGENGRVSEVGRTTTWSAYLGDIYFDNAADVPYIGVRSVSTDLKTYSPIVWVRVPRATNVPDFVEEDSYGVSAMNPACEGADIARRERYVTDIYSTGAEQNINLTGLGPVKDGSQYADHRDVVLKVRQGQTIKMHIKCADFSDGLKWCFAGGWMDLNGSGDFDHPLGITPFEAGEETDPEGERLFKVGKIRAASPEFQSTGINFEFTVPQDATPGKSRFRVVFSDAWFAGMFLPTGLHAKGFSMDFGCEIVGTNPGRTAADTRDQGQAEEPEMLDGGVVGVDAVANAGVSQAEYADGVLNLTNVEKAWVYSADGKFVKFASESPEAIDLEGLAPGAYIVKMQYQNVMRTAKFLVK